MNLKTKWKMTRILITTVYLFAGWLLFSGSLNLISMAMGLFFSGLTALLTYSLFIDEKEAERRGLVFKLHLLIFYLLFLLFKMYASSFAVLYNVIRGNINPRVVHFRTKLKSDIARVILTNSITLTPGTITLNLDDDHLIVHWLDAKTTHSRYAGELIKGKMEKILKRIFV
ncbi:MAG: Na+/H+ antiporter subunit E [Spirochaetia bacterium]|jgi:multicomponent Na+:H+ antiporter subunit E|nr:Na+/H+ antiporter subunit E [Spirochaetia bacterium]